MCARSHSCKSVCVNWVSTLKLTCVGSSVGPCLGSSVQECVQSQSAEILNKSKNQQSKIFYKNNKYSQRKAKCSQIFTKKGKVLFYPQTKMAHCPQCVQKYNTRGMAQVRQNVRERSPKLGWQKLYLKNTTKTNQTNKIKKQEK